jgi:hypothetical protein
MPYRRAAAYLRALLEKFWFLSDSSHIEANFAAFEIDDEVLSNLREYAFANSLYWVSANIVRSFCNLC